MNLKSPDLDLNWRIHSKYKCRFFGFMIHFWILVKKKNSAKPAFRFKNPDLYFAKKTHLKSKVSTWVAQEVLYRYQRLFSC